MSEKREPMVADDDLDAHYDKYDDGPYTAAANMRDWYEGFIDKGDLIHKDELLKWLDGEMAMAEENFEEAERLKMAVNAAAIRTRLSTYKAVKAHIEG